MPVETVSEYVDNLRVRLIASRDNERAISMLSEDCVELGFTEQSRIPYLVSLAYRLTELAGYALYEAANLAPIAECRGKLADGEERVLKEWSFENETA